MADQDVLIHSIARLNINKGDVLVVHLKHTPSGMERETLKRVMAAMPAHLGVDFHIPVIILERGMELSILSATDLKKMLNLSEAELKKLVLS